MFEDSGHYRLRVLEFRDVLASGFIEPFMGHSKGSNSGPNDPVWQ